jgi:prepilin-type N-terminal cleavage/methylation domain-containing protein
MSVSQINNKGFTLIEISVVLVVIGLLIGGAVPLMSVLSERKTRNETLDYMSEARAALISFAKINGRLPWAATQGGNGTSVASLSVGDLPFQTLGIRPTDAYGNRLRYAINNSGLNSNLGTDLPTSCSTLRGGLAGAPRVVDSAAAISVAAVLISAGLKDVNADGSVFDLINAGPFTGNNVTGNPNYIRSPPTNTFDDLVVYIDQLTLYGEICGNPQLAVRNTTAANVFVYNRTTLANIGIVASNTTVSYGILSGSQIELRNAAGGGGAIVTSTPAMPAFIAGTGIGLSVP